eukprot:731928-Pleurochrysis_carterae.AAC.1
MLTACAAMDAATARNLFSPQQLVQFNTIQSMPPKTMSKAQLVVTYKRLKVKRNCAERALLRLRREGSGSAHADSGDAPSAPQPFAGCAKCMVAIHRPVMQRLFAAGALLILYGAC